MKTEIEWKDATKELPDGDHDVLVLLQNNNTVSIGCYASHYTYENRQRVDKTGWGYQENGFEYHHFFEDTSAGVVLFWVDFPDNPLFKK